MESWKKEKSPGSYIPGYPGRLFGRGTTAIVHQHPRGQTAFIRNKKGHYEVSNELKGHTATPEDHAEIEKSAQRFVGKFKPQSLELGHGDPVRHKALGVIAKAIARRHGGTVRSSESSHKVEFPKK